MAWARGDQRCMTTRCASLLLSLIVNSLLAEFPLSAQTFTPTAAPAQNWTCIASSADGSKLAAAASYGYLYTSTNFGQTWTAAVTTTNGPEPERPWTGVASSADGSKLVAVANFNPIFLSTNFGQTW